MVSPAIQPGSCSPDRTNKIERASEGAALFSGVSEPTGNGMSSVDTAKPFDIPKREVWEAFKKVKANHGAAGVDGPTVANFEADLSNNLYKPWNRMSSGSYFPPP
jgi:retron-type reverse transcriptase